MQSTAASSGMTCARKLTSGSSSDSSDLVVLKNQDSAQVQNVLQ